MEIKNCCDPCLRDIIYGQAKLYKKIKEFQIESLVVADKNKKEIICNNNKNTKEIICNNNKNTKQIICNNNKNTKQIIYNNNKNTKEIMCELEKILINSEKARENSWEAKNIAKNNKIKLCKIERILLDILKCL